MREISGREIIVLENYNKHGYYSTQLHILDDGTHDTIDINNQTLQKFNCEVNNNAIVFKNKQNADDFIKCIPDNCFYAHYYYLLGDKAFNVDKYIHAFYMLFHLIEFSIAGIIAWLLIF